MCKCDECTGGVIEDDAWSNYPCGCAKGPGDSDTCEECYPVDTTKEEL